MALATGLSGIDPIWMFPIIIFGFAVLAGIADGIHWVCERQAGINEVNRLRRARRMAYREEAWRATEDLST